MEWHLTFQRACPFALHLFLLAPLLYGVALLPECCKAIAGGRERPRAWFIFRGFLTIVTSAPTLVCFLQYASYSRNTGYSLLENSRWFRGQGPRELMDGRFLGYSLWQWWGSHDRQMIRRFYTQHLRRPVLAHHLLSLRVWRVSSRPAAEKEVSGCARVGTTYRVRRMSGVPNAVEYLRTSWLSQSLRLADPPI